MTYDCCCNATTQRQMISKGGWEWPLGKGFSKLGQNTYSQFQTRSGLRASCHKSQGEGNKKGECYWEIVSHTIEKNGTPLTVCSCRWAFLRGARGHFLGFDAKGEGFLPFLIFGPRSVWNLPKMWFPPYFGHGEFKNQGFVAQQNSGRAIRGPAHRRFSGKFAANDLAYVQCFDRAWPGAQTYRRYGESPRRGCHIKARQACIGENTTYPPFWAFLSLFA